MTRRVVSTICALRTRNWNERWATECAENGRDCLLQVESLQKELAFLKEMFVAYANGNKSAGGDGAPAQKTSTEGGTKKRN
jgi:hypothetical protein